MIVCSLITISVVSGRGRLTRDAMAVASVSTIILVDSEIVRNEKLWYR